MNMISKLSTDDASIESRSKLFLFTFWQKIRNEPTENVSLIYVRPLLAAGVLARGDRERLLSLTSVYLALIQS